MKWLAKFAVFLIRIAALLSFVFAGYEVYTLFVHRYSAGALTLTILDIIIYVCAGVAFLSCKVVYREDKSDPSEDTRNSDTDIISKLATQGMPYNQCVNHLHEASTSVKADIDLRMLKVDYHNMEDLISIIAVLPSYSYEDDREHIYVKVPQQREPVRLNDGDIIILYEHSIIGKLDRINKTVTGLELKKG